MFYCLSQTVNAAINLCVKQIIFHTLRFDIHVHYAAVSYI